MHQNWGVRAVLAMLFVGAFALTGAANAAASPASAPARHSGCAYAYEWVPGYARVGPRIYSFNLRVHFCWDGTNVTRVDTPETWGAVTAAGHAGGWSYNKDDDRKDSFRNDANPSGGVTYDVKARTRLRQCVQGGAWANLCVQSRNPLIEMTLVGDGSWTVTASQP